MPAMSALRAYKEAEYHLTQNLMEKERLERKAHRGSIEAGYQNPYLQAWLDATSATVQAQTALHAITQLIKEIESK